MRDVWRLSTRGNCWARGKVFPFHVPPRSSVWCARVRCLKTSSSPQGRTARHEVRSPHFLFIQWWVGGEGLPGSPIWAHWPWLQEVLGRIYRRCGKSGDKEDEIIWMVSKMLQFKITEGRKTLYGSSLRSSAFMTSCKSVFKWHNFQHIFLARWLTLGVPH